MAWYEKSIRIQANTDEVVRGIGYDFLAGTTPPQFSGSDISHPCNCAARCDFFLTRGKNDFALQTMYTPDKWTSGCGELIMRIHAGSQTIVDEEMRRIRKIADQRKAPVIVQVSGAAV